MNYFVPPISIDKEIICRMPTMICMVRLEELTVGVYVNEVSSDGPVEVIAVKWFGSTTIDLTYKIPDTGQKGTRLLAELPKDWDPRQDKRFTIWEATHHMTRVLEKGKVMAADLMTKLGSDATSARERAYRLYYMCKQKNYAQESQYYNALVQSRPEISKLSRYNILTPSSEGMKQYDNR